MTGLFEDDIKGKKAQINSMVKEAYENAIRTPQAILKISGFSKAPQKLQAHIRYISRAGTLTGQTETQDSLTREAMQTKVQQWIEQTRARKNGRIAMKMILSAPAGSSVKDTTKAIDQFAKQTFGDNHDYFYVIHTDTNYPHGHLVVRVQGYDNKRLDPKKKDLENWRIQFAARLRANGIEATATRRASRGVCKKTDVIDLEKIRQRKQIPRIDQAILKAAVDELKGKPQKSPWLDKIKKTNQAYQKHYIQLGEQLLSSEDAHTRKIGQTIKTYGENFPAAKTRQQEYKDKLLQNIKSNQKGRGGEAER